MTVSIAELAYKIDATSADKAATSLDRMSKAAGGAETSQEKLAAAGRAAANANGIVGASAQQATAQIAAEAAAMRTLEAAHLRASKSSNALSQAGLNLTRQFSDVGVSLAGGISPLMVLIQQGPQIADGFAVAKMQGLGFSAVIKGLTAQLLPFAPILLAVGAAVGVVVGAFAIFEREIDKNTKNATTFGDTFKAVFQVIGAALMNGPIGEGLKFVRKFFDDTLDGIVSGAATYIARFVGFWGSAYNAIVGNFRNLPAVIGAIVQNAVNLSLKNIEGFINATIGGLNRLLKAVGGPELAKVSLGQVQVFSGKIVNEIAADQKRIEAQTLAALSGFASKVAAQADKNFTARQKATKGAKDHAAAMSAEAKAAEELDRALNSLLKSLETTGEKTLREYNENTLLLRAGLDAGKISADQFRDAMDRLNPVIVAANDAQKAFSGALEKTPADLAKAVEGTKDLRTQAERLEDIFYGIANAVDDVFAGIAGNNWVGAFSGLMRALDQVKVAFSAAGSAQDKYAAIGAVGAGIGGAIGGRAGGAISGAASGFAAGASLGSIVPGVGTLIGGGIGAIVGGIGGLFGGGKAKKRAKQQAAADAAAAATAAAAAEADRVLQVANQRRDIEIRLMELQGNASGALAARRADELKATDETNRALLEQTYAAIDAAEAATKATGIANERRSLEVRLMEATGNAADALAARRADELAALDGSNRAVLEAIYAAEDLAAANAKLAEKQAAATEKVTDSRSALTDAYERESSAIQATKEKFQGFADSLAAFRKDLGGVAAAGGNAFQQYSRTRAEFNRLSAMPAGSEERLAGLQGAGSAFLAASRAAAGTGQAFNRDLALVRQAVEASEAAAGQQVSAAQAQLDQLTSVVGQLVELNTNTLSVADAVISLREALLAAPVSNGNTELLGKIDAMTAEIAGMRAEQNGQLGSIVKTNETTAKTLVRVTQDGDALLTVAA